jgi:hypothetical protein
MFRKYHKISFFSSFFVFFYLRRVAGVSALFWSVAGLGLSRALLPLYMSSVAGVAV